MIKLIDNPDEFDTFNKDDIFFIRIMSLLKAYSTEYNFALFYKQIDESENITAIISRLDNDYTVYNDMGHKLEGDYDTWGLSLSAEYGRRMQMQNGFYIDPSVQFTVGRVAGADYSAASDFLDSKGLKKDMYVSQDAFTSAIGRIGLGMGKTTDKAMFYTKFALAHEFSGDFTTTFAAENKTPDLQNVTIANENVLYISK